MGTGEDLSAHIGFNGAFKYTGEQQPEGNWRLLYDPTRCWACATKMEFMSETKSKQVHSGVTGKCLLRQRGKKKREQRQMWPLKPRCGFKSSPESEAKRCVSFCLNATEVSRVEIIPAVVSVTGLPCALTEEELDWGAGWLIDHKYSKTFLSQVCFDTVIVTFHCHSLLIRICVCAEGSGLVGRREYSRHRPQTSRQSCSPASSALEPVECLDSGAFLRALWACRDSEYNIPYLHESQRASLLSHVLYTHFAMVGWLSVAVRPCALL